MSDGILDKMEEPVSAEALQREISHMRRGIQRALERLDVFEIDEAKIYLELALEAK